MQSNPCSCRSMGARASPWRRVLNALTIAAFGALLLFVAAGTVHATATPHRAVFSRGAAIVPDVTASLDASAFRADGPDCDTDDARRSGPEFRTDRAASDPFPDFALDERDDDDDDLHRTLAAAPSRLNARHALDHHHCPLLEGAMAEHQTPNEFLTDSVRRM